MSSIVSAWPNMAINARRISRNFLPLHLLSPAGSSRAFASSLVQARRGGVNFARIRGACALAGFPEYNLAEARDSFSNVGNVLIDSTVKRLPSDMPATEIQWVRRMLEYNVKGGKMNRGLMVVECGATLLEDKGVEVTGQQLTKLAVLGWCVEWLQAWLLIADDIMDASETRRGQPCWYKHEDVKMIAINDSLLLEMFVYRLLKQHFQNDDCYPLLVDLFHETTYNTELGQLADTRCMDTPLEELTMERWTWICKYKTAFYSFYLPVALGMVFAGIRDAHIFEVAKEPLLSMGIYFQAQDDYLDCFGEPDVLGKIGTDIQDRKCSWLFVQAYHLCASQEQKRTLEQYYGACSVGSQGEQEVKRVYAELELQNVYHAYANERFEQVCAMRETVEEAGLPWSIFESFLNKIHNRNK